MIFWDASAIIPLLIREATTEPVEQVFRQDPAIVVWWGTRVECESGLARNERLGLLATRDARLARGRLNALVTGWDEIPPSDAIRETAALFLRRHPLRAGDALQLAAATAWAEGHSRGNPVITLDKRLAGAAQAEGFELLVLPPQAG